MAGSADIRTAIELAADDLRRACEHAPDWRVVAETAIAELARVTAGTSRPEPGQAREALRRARELANLVAERTASAVDRADDYLAGV